MNYFASGPKKNYYGKGDIIVYRLDRAGQPPANRYPVFGAVVKILVHGDSFWPTYTTGDNTGLIATDSMKNFVQRETANFPGSDLDSYCRFLAEKFLGLYPQTEGAQVSAVEIPYQRSASGSVAFTPAGRERATARVEVVRDGSELRAVEARSGIADFKLLRLNGSAFAGFVRDQYTTLPDIFNRPLNMWLDIDWTYTDPAAACNEGSVVRQIRELVLSTFDSFESGSIQQVIHQIGTGVLADIPSISEVNLEANNRTWDTVVEQGDALGIYTDPRPPYGCLGLTLHR